MPGLGERASTRDEKVTIPEEDAPRDSRQNIACPSPPLAYHDTVAMPRPSTVPPESRVAPARGKARPSPVRVDRVGVAAIELASRDRPTPASAPRLAKARSEVERASLGADSAQVLAWIDGARSVQGLADATGIPRDRVETIVARLERLGFVARR